MSSERQHIKGFTANDEILKDYSARNIYEQSLLLLFK
jgi:hypothetical protein